MNIDWSKAPEATHYDTRPGCERAFMRKNHNGRDWEYLGRDNYWIMYGPIPDSKLADLIARPMPWTGEGLPPVGTVCEIKHTDLVWTRCEIVAHKVMDCGGKTHAIAWIDENTMDQSQGLRFRPIRTAEQIAAEDREAKAKAMYLSIYFAEPPESWDRGPDTRRETFRKAIDAGWQQVKP